MAELQPGDPRRLGPYELTERLGEGGQGTVYLGHDTSGEQVAVKLLRGDLTEDESARGRFVREAQAAKRVARFCTAQVLDADVAGDRPYIVSEFVPGPSLDKLIKEEGPRTGAALERLAIGTATALVAIHQADIVHRDFKPHNVLMAPDGPRVIDFGIARALESGSTASTKAIGTPAYMAPEQIAGRPLTPAVDIFAWGATMVFAATGRPPFGQDQITAVINRVLNEEPDLSGIPDDLRPLIADCLAKEPEHRPTAQSLMMRLIGDATPGSGAPIPVPVPGADATRVQRPVDELPTTVLAEGVHRAEPVGGSTAVLGPAAATQAPPARRRSPWPIIAAVGAVAAVLLLVAGLVALMGDDKERLPAVIPTTSESSGEPTEDTEEPSAPATRPRTSAPPSPSEQPSSEPPPSEPPPSDPPPSDPPPSDPPVEDPPDEPSLAP